MRRPLLLSLGAWLLAVSASAQTPVVLAWDPGVCTPSAAGVTPVVTCPAPTTNYTLLYGAASGTYTVSTNVGLTCPGLPTDPLACTGTIALVPGTWFIAAEAVNASGASAPSAEVQTTIPPVIDPLCVAPLGADAIALFPTAYLPSGNGGAGSAGTLYFQAASPNSPITSIGLQANGAYLPALPGSVNPVTGPNEGGVGALWFQVPTASGTYPISLTATNAHGCVQNQSTSYAVVVP